MAESRISEDQDQFSCPACQNLLRDPVTIPCGHRFCMECINDRWNQEDQGGVYSCPQCRETFNSRPVLKRNSMLAQDSRIKTEHQSASADHSYAVPGDVECDVCTGSKYKAVKSCLSCLITYCATHIKPHYQSPAFKKHKLIEASSKLQENLCSNHEKLSEIYCRTDQRCICSLCLLGEHKSHDTVTVEAERREKQNELTKDQRKSQQRIQEKLKRVQELKKAMDNINSFQSLCVYSGCEDSPGLTVNQIIPSEKMKKHILHLKMQLEEFYKEELSKVPACASQMVSASEPKKRKDFLKWFCELTLDPDTAHCTLHLSENNRLVTVSESEEKYEDLPDRFDHWKQVLCREAVHGCCYWEVEWTRVGGVHISVSYKGISRKGQDNKSRFGYNDCSWSLECSSSSPFFWHNGIRTVLQSSISSRIGVYVHHSAGTLSFYSVSDKMSLLHRVQTTFTEPLYAGFWVGFTSTVRLCNKL